ncbi:uncharacterized protein Bfra_006387 [Botrytis fragariae]|uniref:Uncharacterized protein n=1 Tax=Botrytis fragariae TaxID=1964551 RepID=A0A8H6ENY3_9HELO|nr:uncharacterized protein Bfra_006387 [Botrytis fragariae]KAF5879182.1 hypothetical protein Bfra_006387 [Botrytis fragariae]
MTFVVDMNAKTSAQTPVPKYPIFEHHCDDEVIKQMYSLNVRGMVFESSVAYTPCNVVSLKVLNNLFHEVLLGWLGLRSVCCMVVEVDDARGSNQMAVNP